MKKIILSLLTFGLVLTSCNMDLDKPGTITDSSSLVTADDAKAFRNNVYSSFRALTSGSYITNTELEMDKFLGTYDNGHRGQSFATAQIFSNNSDINDDYAGCYSVMKNINFAIEKSTELLEGGALLDNEVQDVNRYIGEMKFMRAYIYYWLYDHFCQAYDETKADMPGLGVQIVTTYDPTGDVSKYPGRSTMNEAFELINKDLNEAFDALVEFEKIDASNCVSNAPYLSSYAVAAFQSRIALLKKDYTRAIDKANYVINSGKFPLTTFEDEAYYDMWINDEGSELIFVPFVNSNESAYVGSNFNAFNYSTTYPTRVDYLPTYEALTAYEDGDIRFDSFFDVVPNMQFGPEKTSAYVFLKFPGNDALISGSNQYKNKPKPFRTSELYLIVAEAAYESNQPAVANKALNDLRAARIEGYEEETHSGINLRDNIRDERAKELIGEGFRMSDLRRWNLGFKRDGSWPGMPSIVAVYLQSNINVSFSPGDYRYVWPIPQHQFNVNPQLKGQQNPGYSNE